MHVLLLLLFVVVVIFFSLRLLLLECAALKTLHKKRLSKVVKERTRGTTKNDNTNAHNRVDDTDIFLPRRLFVVGVAKKETLWLVVVGQSRRPNNSTQ